MKNKIIIISSPSGAGKTTICKHLIKKNKNIKLSISFTTRPKRKNEKNATDYYFINQKEFLLKKRKKYFIETAKVFDYYYGSPLRNINEAFRKNKHILFDIDWQGAKKIRKKFKKSQIIDFFILPPTKKELKRRLINRGRDNNKEIKKRLSLAVDEISHYNEYKFVLINDKIKDTVNNLKKIIDYETFKEKNNIKILKYKID
ncbi:MAG: Guanylate kinase [Alphaproteobacteria bacterium MarineAlpha5_Bin8]|nr:MAG: Guanylate kinase [Alphaproteobacteria bacterium MarineAlpha5_Bin7]PPR46422.1 MAG: Guanylate kinase [Alphaproteobacteria bacterium MarineAlpha5_Bin8]|tara:strand:- start:3674 stop:4279 length:606 start_codon:yes stop_codon:yes gene_type:complete